MQMTPSSLRFGDVFPFPNYVDVRGSAGLIGVSADLQFNGPDNEILKGAFDRVVQNIKDDKFLPLEANSSVWANVAESASIKEVAFNVKSVDADLQHGVNESYTLNIADEERVAVTAETVWGGTSCSQHF